jgi:uncharacterized coiled-coil protein SlyX
LDGRVTATEEAEEQDRSAESYLSPALSRLEQTPRRRSPARSIVEQSYQPAEASPMAARVSELEARLANVEQHELDLAANLVEANLAFRRLAERLASLTARLEGGPAGGSG